MGRTAGRKQEIIIVPEGYWVYSHNVEYYYEENDNE